jgi:hypothetical protein
MLSEALLIAIGIAAEAAGLGGNRPNCNVVTRGLMWPLEANYGGRVAAEEARKGTLEICTRGNRVYRWVSPVVHVSKLRREPGAKD